jgi:hypothetical protein
MPVSCNTPHTNSAVHAGSVFYAGIVTVKHADSMLHTAGISGLKTMATLNRPACRNTPEVGEQHSGCSA